MIEFAWPWAFALLVLPLLMRKLPKAQSGGQSALRVPGMWMAQRHLAPQQNKRISPVLLALIWICLVLACARPQWLGEATNIPSQGREMMLAVDLSGSMEVEDMQLHGRQVNRLVMLKAVLRDFIQRRVGDRLGLILFADTAYMQTPMTYDRQTVETMLDEAVLGLVGEKTAIGDAIGLAVKRFDKKQDSNKVLILITDGQNTAGNVSPEDALKLAVRYDVTVYTIGVGADSMLVRSLFGTRKVNPSSELDESLLTEIAEQTGGQYFRARDTESLVQIYQLLDQLEPIDSDDQQFRPLKALFFWPLGLALCFSLLAFLPPLPGIFRRKAHG